MKVIKQITDWLLTVMIFISLLGGFGWAMEKLYNPKVEWMGYPVYKTDLREDQISFNKLVEMGVREDGVLVWRTKPTEN